MEAKIYELANGLRVIHKYIPYTRTVHCGYIINTGSRDDGKEEAGMAHFIEHMLFKGTGTRNNFEILDYLDSLGGDLNAYTTKEKTCIYASLVSDYFERATDLLTDITFFATFPDEEIDKEKDVISEEIDMYRDAPDEAIFEDFDEQIFPNHSLGRPILGTKESIRTFDKNKARKHINNVYTSGNIIYSIVGNVSSERVEQAIERYLKGLEIPVGIAIRKKPNERVLKRKEVSIPTQQAHIILGGRAYESQHSLNIPFSLVTNILGGPAMNSRLNLNIRERFGLSYNINAFYSSFLDTGMWGVYYACEPGNIEKIQELIFKELSVFKDQPLGIIQLKQAKRQLCGQLTLGYENLLTQMLGMAKDLLDYGRIIPFSEYLEQVEQITKQQIQQTAVELFNPNMLSNIAYKKAM